MAGPSRAKAKQDKHVEGDLERSQSPNHQSGGPSSYADVLALQSTVGNRASNYVGGITNVSSSIAPNAEITQQLLHHLNRDFLFAKSDTSEALAQCVQQDILNESDEPILNASLSQAALLGDYKSNARQFLSFRIEAMIKWVDIVIRKQITAPAGGGNAKAAESLQEAAKQANILGSIAWKSKQILEMYDILIKDKLPDKRPEDSPGPEAMGTTMGSVRWIRENFSRKALDEMGFSEIPDITRLLEGLGFPPQVTKEEITAEILRSEPPADKLLQLGLDKLYREGKVHLGGRDLPPGASPEWKDKKYTSEEIQRIGRTAIPTDDLNVRELTRMLLQAGRQADPAEIAVLAPNTLYPSYNLAALRLVLERLRKDAATRFEHDQANLNQFLDQYPLLRMYVVKINLLLNDSILGRDYRDIIDPSAIKPETLNEKLDQLIASLNKIGEKVKTDDDFLFDNAIKPTLLPIIQLYARVEPIYEKWILDEFENNARWQEFVDEMQMMIGLLAFLGIEFYSAGLVTPFLMGFGIGLGIGQTLRSVQRAGDIEAAAHAGIAGLDEAALAQFKAWLDEAMLIATVAPLALRALRSVVAKALWKIRMARTPSGARIWEPTLPEVIDPMTGEYKQLTLHGPSGEIYELQYNPLTQSGTLTRLRDGQRFLIVNGKLQQQPKGLFTAGTPSDTTAPVTTGGETTAIVPSAKPVPPTVAQARPPSLPVPARLQAGSLAPAVAKPGAGVVAEPPVHKPDESAVHPEGEAVAGESSTQEQKPSEPPKQEAEDTKQMLIQGYPKLGAETEVSSEVASGGQGKKPEGTAPTPNTGATPISPQISEPSPFARGGPLTIEERERAERLLKQSLGQAQAGPAEVTRWPSKPVKNTTRVVGTNPEGKPSVVEFEGRGVKGELITVRTIKGQGQGRVVRSKIENINALPREARDTELARAMKAAGMGDWESNLGHIHPSATRGAEMPYNLEPQPGKWNKAIKGKSNRRTAEIRFQKFLDAHPNDVLSVEISRKLNSRNALQSERFCVRDISGEAVFDVEVTTRGKLIDYVSP